METQNIDLGSNIIRSCLQESRQLVVSFEGGGDRDLATVEGGLAWGQALIAEAGWDGLFAIPKILDWYQAPELWEFFSMMRKTGFFGSYDSVVTYGSSMGGFAALAFAKSIGANRVVALQPRTSLHHTFPWPSKQSSRLNYSRVGPHADALGGVRADMDILIFADPLYPRDWRHAKRVLNATLFRTPFSAHHVPEYFNEMGVLGEISRAALGGTLNRAWFNQVMRERRHTKTYWAGMNMALSRRRKPKSSVV